MKNIYFVVIFLFVKIVYGQYTDVSGIQSGTWEYANSPYRVTGDVTVSSGTTLTIEPGVEVNFNGSYRILVQGTLIAKGTIQDSIIFKHVSEGSYHYGIDIDQTTTTSELSYCRIQDGDADNTSAPSPFNYYGGAVGVYNSDIIIRHCLFKNNKARFGGAVGIRYNCDITVESNRFYNNTGSWQGGAICCYGGSGTNVTSGNIKNNIIANNQTNTSTYGGGGISLYRQTNVNIINNIFYSNDATGYGGGLLLFTSETSSSEEVIANVSNNIFWSNTQTRTSNTGSTQIDTVHNVGNTNLNVNYNDIQGGFSGGTGNINSDPSFVDVSNYDFHLSVMSPCIDVGNSLNAPTVDADSNATNQDGNNSGTSEHDMGAFEFLQDVNIYSSSTSADYFSDTFESGTSNQITAIAVNGVSSGSSAIAVNCYTKSNTPYAPSGSKSIKRWYSIAVSGDLVYTDADLRLFFSNTDENLDNLTTTNLRLWHYNGSAWENISGTVTTGSNWVELSGISPSDLQGLWAFSDPSDHPLPVELTSFTAIAGDEMVTLKWQTASEINNMGYLVYRSMSKDADYEKIASYEYNDNLKGVGTTSNKTKYEYVDRQVVNGQTYWYKIADEDINGNKIFHGPLSVTPMNANMDKIDTNIPQKWFLAQNYPNPFNPSTKIIFDVPAVNGSNPNVQVIVYDMQGKKVKILLSGSIASGTYELEWNGTNDNGDAVSSGIYFYQLISARYNVTKKMMLMR